MPTNCQAFYDSVFIPQFFARKLNAFYTHHTTARSLMHGYGAAEYAGPCVAFRRLGSSRLTIASCFLATDLDSSSRSSTVVTSLRSNRSCFFDLVVEYFASLTRNRTIYNFGRIFGIVIIYNILHNPLKITTILHAS